VKSVSAVIVGFFLLSMNASASPAPRAGELMGGFEATYLSPVQEKDSGLSDALRAGIFITHSIPFGVSVDFGFLNSSKQRSTRFNLFNFGRQPAVSPHRVLDYYLRAEVLSATWNEGGGVNYTPGLEAGVTISVSRDDGLALFSKATFTGQKTTSEKRWGQESSPEAVAWVGLSFLKMSVAGETPQLEPLNNRAALK
jgi:hypothetical protein